MNICLAQINFDTGHPFSNLKRIEKALDEAPSDTQLLVFPELTLTGYLAYDLLFRDALKQTVQDTLNEVARLSENCDLLVGAPYWEDNNCFNSAFYFRKGALLARYDKRVLPNDTCFSESRYFEKGHSVCLIPFEEETLAILICEDFWSHTIREETLSHHPSHLVILNASPFHLGKSEKRQALLQKTAEKNACALYYVNWVGAQDGLVFAGDSTIAFPEASQSIQTPLLKPIFLTEKTKPLLKTPPPIATLYDALVFGLREQFHRNQVQGAVIGLSGGMDSALTAVIAVDALGAEHVELWFLPSRYTRKMSEEDAMQLAENLQCSLHTQSIEPLFETLLETQPLKENLSQENAQARLRALLLMARSNDTGLWLLNTSNKSEVAMGYGTLYGDLSGSFGVLQDVYKTDVYRLAEYRNQCSPVIPERILKRPPSAELSENQLDSDSLLPYPMLDLILKGTLEEQKNVSELVSNTSETQETIVSVLKQLDAYEFKRKQAPPSLRVSSHSFGHDHRMPLSHGCQQSHR